MARITFMTPTLGIDNIVVDVESGTSILEAAEESGALVGSSCGGECACSTCHIYITQGDSGVTEMEDEENDRLDMAFDVRAESRLGCQACVQEGADIVVEISEESVKAWYDEHPDERKRSGFQGGR